MGRGDALGARAERRGAAREPHVRARDARRRGAGGPRAQRRGDPPTPRAHGRADRGPTPRGKRLDRLTGPATAQPTCRSSAAIVVASPGPVGTTVSPGRVSSCDRIDSRIVGLSLNERPVAPGPPWKSVSPVKTVACSGEYRQVLPGE